jgi:hypothetical protein
MRRLTAVAAIATLVCELSDLGAAPENRIDVTAIVSKKAKTLASTILAKL